MGVCVVCQECGERASACDNELEQRAWCVGMVCGHGVRCGLAVGWLIESERKIEGEVEQLTSAGALL